MNQSYLRNSLGLRLAIIAFLSLMLLIPTAMIISLIRERQITRDVAVREVFSKWGTTQTISGPILSVPYKIKVKYEDNKTVTKIKYMHLLPDKLSIDGIVNPEIRYRGIYEVVLFNAKLNFSGTFTPQEIEMLNIPQDNILWDKSFLSLGISDMKGIKEIVKVKWNQEIFTTNPGIKSNDVLASGISVKIPLDLNTGDYHYSLDININGSEDLLFVPVGKETNLKLNSTWRNPSFTGNFLPELRKIDETGFESKWQILHLNRNYPQVWAGKKHDIQTSAFGVRLLIPVDEYQKIMRTAKYAILYIALTFLAFFMIELLNRKTIHPVQYLLVGFALLVFYTLLLSFSEHMLFKFAYLISSVAIIVLITIYTKSVLKSNLHTSLISGVLSVLYIYLYVILQLQDFALLMGSIGLFAVLSLVMFLTRKTDWFTILTVSARRQVNEQ